MSPIKREVVIGDCRLLLADMSEIVPTLGVFDVCLTDPPYGLKISSNPVRQAHDRQNWDDAPPSAAIFKMLLQHSREQIIWGGNYFGLPASQCFLVWDKKQPENFSLAMCEMAWASRSQPAKMWRQSVTSYAKEHPTQKPVELMEWCIGIAKGCGTVLDPFMGSGTTGVACAKRGMSFTGIELHEPYFDAACERIRKAYAQPDMFVAAPEPKAVGYTAITRNGKPAADGPRYKALGNSMACNVMRWIGQRIEHVNAIAASIKSEAA